MASSPIPKNGFILTMAQEEPKLADTLPRPVALVEVAGQSMLSRTLDHYANAGVQRVIINCQGKTSALEKKLKKRTAPAVIVSEENAPLGTGGGLANCIDILGDSTFYVVRSDALWFDGADATLEKLALSWDDSKMDALLLLYPATTVKNYDGQGDYFVDQLGLTHRRTESVAPYIYTGIAILHSRLFYDMPEAPFELDALLKNAEKKNRLYSIIHGGSWHHLNTQADLAEAERFIKSKDLA